MDSGFDTGGGALAEEDIATNPDEARTSAHEWTRIRGVPEARSEVCVLGRRGFFGIELFDESAIGALLRGL